MTSNGRQWHLEVVTLGGGLLAVASQMFAASVLEWLALATGLGALALVGGVQVDRVREPFSSAAARDPPLVSPHVHDARGAGARTGASRLKCLQISILVAVSKPAARSVRNERSQGGARPAG